MKDEPSAAAAQKPLLSDILLELHVPAFQPVKDFYGSLGYEIVWEKPALDDKGYLVMRNAMSIINFYCGTDDVYNHEFFGTFPANTPRGYGVEIVIPSDDIEALFARVKQLYPDNIVASLPGKHSHKDFRVVDPFGYYLRFVERYNWVEGRDAAGRRLAPEPT